MSRPLFVGSYLQVYSGGLSANEKEQKKMHRMITLIMSQGNLSCDVTPCYQ